MSVYAIGDIQGCYEPLSRLLDKLNFDPAADRLWFAGDLINRGPESLKTLRLIYSLRESVVAVLGNHDLHALAVYYARLDGKKKDTVDELYAAEDAGQMMRWLLSCPLAHWDQERQQLLVHAGIPPQWDVELTLKLAGEVETVLAGSRAVDYFRSMYGNEPECWDDRLQDVERWRVITNYLTRMRFIDDRGCLELLHKNGLDTAPAGYKAWFHYPRQDDITIWFGHWAALLGETGLPQFRALDTGCVWGGKLRAVDVDSGETVEVPGQ